MRYLIYISVAFLLLFNSGCGTVFGGKINYCQSHKPKKGEPRREINPAALASDVLLGIFVFEIPTAIDFLDGGIYYHCQNTKTDSIHKADSVKRTGPPPPPLPNALSISTDAAQYIFPQPNINIEYLWNRMAIGAYAGIISPSSTFSVNPFADGQYTNPGTVYTGYAFKLYFKHFDLKKPKRYWCAQLVYKPEGFDNVTFHDQPVEEWQLYYTMSEKAHVYGLDILRGYEIGGDGGLLLDFFYGFGIHNRIMFNNVTSSNSYPQATYPPTNTGPFGYDLAALTPIIGLRIGLNFVVKHKIDN